MVSNCRSATTLGGFLLFSGLPRQWRFRVAVALTGDKMYCLKEWLVEVVVDMLKTVANSLGVRKLYLSAGQ